MGSAADIVDSIVRMYIAAQPYVLPVKVVALLYILLRKYHGKGATIAGIPKKKLEQDIIVAEEQIKRLKKEKERVMEQIANLRKILHEKEDEEAKKALATAEVNLKRIDADISYAIDRKEFDKLLLILHEHKEHLKKIGAWKDLKAPRKVVKALDKEQEKIEKAEIRFSDYREYLNNTLNSIIEKK